MWRVLKGLLAKVYYFKRCLVVSLSHEGGLASQHLKNSTAKGPYICESLVLFVQYDLGRHPAGGPDIGG